MGRRMRGGRVGVSGVGYGWVVWRVDWVLEMLEVWEGRGALVGEKWEGWRCEEWEGWRCEEGVV